MSLMGPLQWDTTVVSKPEHHNPEQDFRVSSNLSCGRTLPHLLAGAAVVEHDVRERLHAVLMQRSDAGAQVRLAAVRRVQALVVARQVPLQRQIECSYSGG